MLRVMLDEEIGIGVLNEDQHPDGVVILIIDGGGSGSFYHLGVALNDGCTPWKAINYKNFSCRLRSGHAC